jgi:hypothetical protein
MRRRTPPPSASGAARASGRRGRPSKFGRPSQVVALTLPQEVLAALRSIHRDPAWAIVQLVERLLAQGGPSRRQPAPAPVAELVHLPRSRALIVVQPQIFERMPGIATIPLADGRAFLAFAEAGGLADLEVAILDRVESDAATSARRAQLVQARSIVRGWRRDRTLVFRPMRILVAETGRAVERRLLPPFGGPERHRGRPVRRRRGRTRSS